MTKEELQQRAEALYPIHEDDLSLIRNIREYEQNAYIKGYEDAKRELVHAPDGELITNEEFLHQLKGYSNGYEYAKKKFGWHKYPEEKPSEDGEYFVTIDAQDTWHQSSWWTEKRRAFVVWDNNITAWMQIPGEGGNDE